MQILQYQLNKGVTSTPFKILNNLPLVRKQDCNEIGPVHVASIGQLDDVGLLIHDAFALLNLLNLTIDYCSEHHVALAPEKNESYGLPVS